MTVCTGAHHRRDARINSYQIPLPAALISTHVATETKRCVAAENITFFPLTLILRLMLAKRSELPSQRRSLFGCSSKMSSATRTRTCFTDAC